MHYIDRLANQLAENQLGVFARAQLLIHAADADDTIKRRLRTGTWLKLAEGVYGYPGHRDSWRRRLWIAHLASGLESTVSFESAGQLHAYPGVLTNRLILTVPHSGYQRIPGVFVHQISDVLPDHRMMLDGLPVTTPARTMVDLAAAFRIERLRYTLRGAVDQRLVTLLAIGEVVHDVARRGKPGIRKLALLLDELAPGPGIKLTELERILLGSLLAGGEPAPMAQFSHPGRDLPASCVDFAYPEAKLILEADGRRWHQRIQDIKRDRHRDNEATRAGWETLRFLYEQIKSDPDDVVKLVRTVRLDRIRLLAG